MWGFNSWKEELAWCNSIVNTCHPVVLYMPPNFFYVIFSLLYWNPCVKMLYSVPHQKKKVSNSKEIKILKSIVKQSNSNLNYIIQLSRFHCYQVSTHFNSFYLFNPRLTPLERLDPNEFLYLSLSKLLRI